MVLKKQPDFPHIYWRVVYLMALPEYPAVFNFQVQRERASCNANLLSTYRWQLTVAEGGQGKIFCDKHLARHLHWLNKQLTLLTMSNPNTQKLGKRKTAPGTQQEKPEWLWGKSTQAQQSQSKTPQNPQKKLAEDLLKRRAAGEQAKSSPPAQLVEYVFSYFYLHQR